jgi:hypothetical protein
MLEIFRRGEVLPEGRTNEEEEALIQRALAGGQTAGVGGQGLGQSMF